MTHLEETLDILQDVDAAVREVSLLGAAGVSAFEGVLVEHPRTVFLLFLYLPFDSNVAEMKKSTMTKYGHKTENMTL